MDALLQRREQPRAQRAALADQNRQLSERTGHAVAAHASQRTAHVANAARRWLDPFICHLSDPVLDLVSINPFVWSRGGVCGICGGAWGRGACGRGVCGCGVRGGVSGRGSVCGGVRGGARGCVGA